MRLIVAITVVAVSACGSSGKEIDCDCGRCTADIGAGDLGANGDVLDATTDVGTSERLVADASSGPFFPEMGVGCSSNPLSVYAGHGPRGRDDQAQRGQVLECSVDVDYSAEYVEQRLALMGVPEPANGVHAVRTYLILYRTERVDGIIGYGSARVYIPSEPLGDKVGFAVAAHGTSGLADYCAPSIYTSSLDYLVLPLVAAGVPVIAPDYAGLGTPGVQGYGNASDTGHSVLDAARAMINILGQRWSGHYVVYGHSQGGGASLAAQGLQPEYGPPGLAGVVAFAPGYSYNPCLVVYADDFPLSTGAGVVGAAIALRMYADFANLLGEEKAGYPFSQGIRKQVVKAIKTLCIQNLAVVIPSLAATVGDLLDDTFQESAKQCLGAGQCAVEEVQGWVERCSKSIVEPAPQGGDIVVFGGTADIQVLPARIACLVQWLESSGVKPTVCMVDGANHLDLVTRSYAQAQAREVLLAMLKGQPLPKCSSEGLPQCQE